MIEIPSPGPEGRATRRPGLPPRLPVRVRTRGARQAGGPNLSFSCRRPTSTMRTKPRTVPRGAKVSRLGSEDNLGPIVCTTCFLLYPLLVTTPTPPPNTVTPYLATGFVRLSCRASIATLLNLRGSKRDSIALAQANATRFRGLTVHSGFTQCSRAGRGRRPRRSTRTARSSALLQPATSATSSSATLTMWCTAAPPPPRLRSPGSPRSGQNSGRKDWMHSQSPSGLSPAPSSSQPADRRRCVAQHRADRRCAPERVSRPRSPVESMTSY